MAGIKGVGIHNIHGTFVGARRLSYNCETIYKAELAHDSIFFVLTNRRKSILSIMRADVSDDDWTHYNVSAATAGIRHHVTSGTWIINFKAGDYLAIVFKKKSEPGCVFNPHIHEANMVVPTEDVFNKNTKAHNDMVDAAIYGTACTPAEYAKEEVRRTLKWYEKTKKEVKGKMLQLIDVIIFNRKTEVVDFRKDIVAPDRSEASLVAVQEFGKYDPKIHIIEEKCILEFTEIKEK